MSNISKERVEHIAKLARIELTEEEKEKFFKELSSILDYVEKLGGVDTSKMGQMGQVTGLENIMREDKIRGKKQEARGKLLKEAPKRKGNYIQVPKVLE